MGDRPSQPPQPVLQQVVVSAELHQLDRGAFPDGSRHDDERQVGAVGLLDAEGAFRVELGEAVVGQDEIPRSLQRSDELRLRRHAIDLAVESGEKELGLDQLGVERIVFDHDDSEGGSHHTSGAAVGGWFNSSQYRPSVRTASANCSKSTGFTM